MMRHSLAILLAAAALASFTGCGSSSGSHGAGASAASVRLLKGSATVRRGDRDMPVSAAAPVALLDGDTVETAAASEAVITAGKKVQLLAEKTRLRIDSLADGTTPATHDRVTLFQGLATFFLPAHQQGYQFEAMTSTVAAAVKGTIFSLETTDAGVRASVIRGEVALLPVDAGGAVGTTPLGSVTADHRVSVAGGAIKDEPLSAAESATIKEDLILKKEQLKIDVTTM